MADHERKCDSCGVTEEKAPYGPGGKRGPKLFIRKGKLICYACLTKLWRKQIDGGLHE